MSQNWDEPAPVDKRGFKPLTVAGDLSEGLRRIRLARLCERAGDYTAKKNLVNGYWERVLGALPVLDWVDWSRGSTAAGAYGDWLRKSSIRRR
jgi:hypothetical protein